MKKFTLTFAILCAFCAWSYAGPEPLPSGKEVMQAAAPLPPSCFEGWYFGIQGAGVLQAGNNQTFARALASNPGGTTIVDDATDREDGQWGGAGGAHLGVNFQRGNWVFGAEIDASGTSLQTDGGSADAFAVRGVKVDAVTRSENDLNWFGTVRPRLGYVLGHRVLAFGTGGLAVGGSDLDVRTDVAVQFPAGAPFSDRVTRSTNDINAGWTAGGGFDICLTEHWILNLTYLYVDLGDQDASATHFGPVTGGPRNAFTAEAVGSAHSELRFHVLQAGVSFKF
jgi:outer membrane immunogenic protein